VKQELLSRLDHYLDLFSGNAAGNGMKVHRAADALEACRLVHESLRKPVRDSS